MSECLFSKNEKLNFGLPNQKIDIVNIFNMADKREEMRKDFLFSKHFETRNYLLIFKKGLNWSELDMEKFFEYCSLWTKKIFYIQTREENEQISNHLQVFQWSSCFRNDLIYENTCILFETIMLWNLLALKYYNMALDTEEFSNVEEPKKKKNTLLFEPNGENENNNPYSSSNFMNKNSEEIKKLLFCINERIDYERFKEIFLVESKRKITNGFFYMLKAYKIFHFIIKDLINKWTLREEKCIPFECTILGNSYLSSCCLLKLKTYELYSNFYRFYNTFRFATPDSFYKDQENYLFSNVMTQKIKQMKNTIHHYQQENNYYENNMEEEINFIKQLVYSDLFEEKKEEKESLLKMNNNNNISSFYSNELKDSTSLILEYMPKNKNNDFYKKVVTLCMNINGLTKNIINIHKLFLLEQSAENKTNILLYNQHIFLKKKQDFEVFNKMKSLLQRAKKENQKEEKQENKFVIETEKELEKQQSLPNNKKTKVLLFEIYNDLSILIYCLCILDFLTIRYSSNNTNRDTFYYLKYQNFFFNICFSLIKKYKCFLQEFEPYKNNKIINNNNNNTITRERYNFLKNKIQNFSKNNGKTTEHISELFKYAHFLLIKKLKYYLILNNCFNVIECDKIDNNREKQDIANINFDIWSFVKKQQKNTNKNNNNNNEKNHFFSKKNKESYDFINNLTKPQLIDYRKIVFFDVLNEFIF